jgi:hypothetical protein
VKVEVFGYTGARDLAKVHTYVEPVWMILLLQGQLRSLSKLEHFPGHFGWKPRERRGVLVWNDHQMAGRIREEVEYYKDRVPSMKDEVSAVVALLVDLAEYAGILFFG